MSYRDPSRHARPQIANQHGDDLTFGEAQSATDAKAPDVRRAGFAGVGLLLLAKRAAVLTAVALLLIACGEGGAPSLPSGTSSRSAGELPSLTATVPDLTRSPTRPESPTQTAEPPSPTRSVTRPERPAQTVTTTEPPRRASAEPALAALAAPTPLSTPSLSASLTTPSPSFTTPSPPAPGAAADTSDATGWLWWLLAAVIVAVAVAVPLLLRVRRRRAWRADLAAAEGEVAWFARVLVPELRLAESLDQAAGGWTVGSSQVSALEDRLTALEATAPDDAGRTRARTLRDAVRTARTRLHGLLTAGQIGTFQRDLDAVAAELERALETPQPAW